MTRIVVVIGTRPEAIKLAPVIHALKGLAWAEVVVLLTGQHADLLRDALAVFGLAGDMELGLMAAGQSLAALTGRAFIEIDRAIETLRPDMIVAQGDTTSVMVAAMLCFYRGIPFAHVEAGLRSGDMRSPFPEEMNRIVATRAATLHCAPTARARAALLAEGVDPAAIHVTGNTVIDALAAALPRATPRLRRSGETMVLLTTHRRENLGAPMAGMLRALRAFVEDRRQVRLLVPAHPNPLVRDAVARTLAGHARIEIVPPLGYLDFIAAMGAADIVVTDSGGVQEEAPFLSRPVLVIRDETERPEAVEAGVALLVGTDPRALRRALDRLMDDTPFRAAMSRGGSPYGDGHAATRIAAVIARHFGHWTGPLPTMFRYEPPGEHRDR